MTTSRLVSIFSVVVFPLVYLFVFITGNSNDPCKVARLQNVPASTSQVIVVNHVKGFQANMTACKRKGQSWKRALNSFPAVVGKEGVAPVGTKREGDRKTPAGLYPLGEAFGTEPLGLKMDFKYITSDDKFIDDASHNGYNTWVIGDTNATSYESMLIDAYKMGVVVNFNMNPVIPGAGSAIFIHLWRSIRVGTYGCIAMDEPDLLELLHWLDKAQHPYVSISD